ncbi:MAG: LLM class F420-dependent oxidoreductase [Acidimicrobiia bacterium]
MRIGIYRGDASSGPIEKLVSAARDAADAGYASFWLPQTMGMDAMTALAVVGREIPRVELGIAVVPTFPRHPIVMAQQALTTQAITGGRLTLGIGLSHQPIIEQSYGYPFEKPARHMREYLEALLPLVRDGSVSYAGETITARIGLDVRGSSPVRVLLAALGPKMLELAGGMADGTVTWMTGPVTLAQHVVPNIRAAATAAGRPAPTIGAGFPVCVTDDIDAARVRAAETFAIYGTLPSYRAMLDREGADGPGAVAIMGDEASVRDQIAALGDIGVTDLIASIFGSRDERDRTYAFLSTLL